MNMFIKTFWNYYTLNPNFYFDALNIDRVFFFTDVNLQRNEMK